MLWKSEEINTSYKSPAACENSTRGVIFESSLLKCLFTGLLDTAIVTSEQTPLQISTEAYAQQFRTDRVTACYEFC